MGLVIVRSKTGFSSDFLISRVRTGACPLILETPAQTQVALVVSSHRISVETTDEGSRVEMEKTVRETWNNLEALSHLSLLRLGH